MSTVIGKKEIPFVIMGYDPFPVYERSQPIWIRTAPDPPHFDDARDRFGRMRYDLERQLLWGLTANGYYQPNELDKFKDCTRFIGGMADRCEWVLDAIRKLSTKDMMELLEIVRSQNKQGE